MNNKRWNALWLNAHLATMEQKESFGLISHAAIAEEGGEIVWVGAMADLPGDPENLAERVHDVDGRCITPALMDCHTHLVFAGNRAKEFDLGLILPVYENFYKEVLSKKTAQKALV